MNALPVESWPLRCGRVEGALEVVTAERDALRKALEDERRAHRETRGLYGDLQDAVDEAGCTDAVQACLGANRDESTEETSFDARRDLGVRGRV